MIPISKVQTRDPGEKFVSEFEFEFEFEFEKEAVPSKELN